LHKGGEGSHRTLSHKLSAYLYYYQAKVEQRIQNTLGHFWCLRAATKKVSCYQIWWW